MRTCSGGEKFTQSTTEEGGVAWFVPVTCNLARVEFRASGDLVAAAAAQLRRRSGREETVEETSTRYAEPGNPGSNKRFKTYFLIPRKPTRKPLLLGYFQQNCRKIYRRPIGVGCSYPTQNVSILRLQSFWFGSQRSSNSSRKYQSAMYFPVIFISTSTHIAIKFISPIG